jgi:hypothetical protein
MRHSCLICLTQSIHAERTASFTHLHMRAQCGVERSLYRSVRMSYTINSCFPI